MAYFKKETGNWGEELAAKFLQKRGYKIVGRNVRNHLGEIDILATAPSSAIPLRQRLAGFAGLADSHRNARSAIVVVEVKTKSGREFGEGFEMVNHFKRQKLLLLARDLQSKYPGHTIRIDVISVNTSQKPPEIKHFENAVEEN